jgi:hypothetical protein
MNAVRSDFLKNIDKVFKNAEIAKKNNQIDFHSKWV